MHRGLQTDLWQASNLETEYILKTSNLKKWDLKWRVGCRIVCIEYDRHYLHIKNYATGKTRSCNVKDSVHEPPVKLWNVDIQLGRAGKFVNHPTNPLTITLHND